MKKEQILNDIIAKKGYKSILELTSGPSILDKINCEIKDTVFVRGESSDYFFYKNEKKYDLIFIDGEHKHEQCEKDIMNALKAITKGGVIAMHDINPETIEQQEVPKKSKIWTGDVWRCFVGYPGSKKAFLDDYGLGLLYWTDKIKLGFSSDISAKQFLVNKERYLLGEKKPTVDDIPKVYPPSDNPRKVRGFRGDN